MNTVLFCCLTELKKSTKEFPVVWVLDQRGKKQHPEYLGKIKILTSSHSHHTDSKLCNSKVSTLIWNDSGCEEGSHGEPAQNKNNLWTIEVFWESFLLPKYRDRLGPASWEDSGTHKEGLWLLKKSLYIFLPKNRFKSLKFTQSNLFRKWIRSKILKRTRKKK